MNKKEFQKKYLANFCEMDKNKESVFRLYIRYEYLTEQFDQLLCYQTNGIPVTPRERTLCKSNAKEEYKNLFKLCNYLNINFEEYEQSIKNEINKMSDKTVADYYFYFLENDYYKKVDLIEKEIFDNENQYEPKGESKANKLWL